MYDRRNSDLAPSGPHPAILGVVGVVGLVVVVVVIFGFIAGVKSFNRYQKIADVNNNVKSTEIQIRNTEQLVKVEQQKAQIRIAEAEGIAESQRIIDSSLTDNYLSYLAIQAQIELANSDSNSTIYIPSGNLGIPLVKDVGE